MKILDIKLEKQVIGGVSCLVCTVSPESGEQFGAQVPWRNERGLWASKDNAREPAEISAWLRSFAKAIDEHVKDLAA